MTLSITSESTKRSTTESASSEQIPKRQKVEADIDNIKVCKWSSIWQKLEQAEAHCDFKGKIGHLQARCSVLDKTTCSMWIEFSPQPSADVQECTYLLLTIKQGALKSENIAGELLGLNKNNKNKFYQLTLTENHEQEDDDDESELLKMLISPTGDKGELEWISKGAQFSGKEILSIFERIQSYLGVQTLFLYDDAKFKVYPTDGNNETIELPGHLYLPLASQNGSPFYKSWANFNVLECKDVVHPMHNKIKFNQNIKTFYDAVSLIKNIKINKDYRDKILKNYPNWQIKVNALVRKIKQSVSIGKCTTLGDLFKTLNMELREEQNQARAYRIALLLQESIDFFLRYSSGARDRNNAFIQAYEEALNTLELTRIFVREQVDV